MQIKINENFVEVKEKATLNSLKDKFYPDADVVIYNGHMINGDFIVNDKDVVVFIKKGKIPSENELETLMVARHSPGVHKKLKKGKIAIAGIGGLGSNIAVSLARMGVGYLKLIDYDVVEPSNLNRQQYFTDQIGMLKTDALKQNLLRINPYLHYKFLNEFITENNIEEIFKDVDIVIEAFDKAEYKSMLVRFVSKIFPDKKIIGASGIAGLNDPFSMKVTKLSKNVYVVGDLVNEAKPGQGLVATRVAVAANIQANLAVNIILEEL